VPRWKIGLTMHAIILVLEWGIIPRNNRLIVNTSSLSVSQHLLTSGQSSLTTDLIETQLVVWRRIIHLTQGGE